jgi:transposase
VIAECQQRHRSVEFPAFLDRIDQRVPPESDVHLILDNASAHKTARIRNWLAKRPRYHVHFTFRPLERCRCGWSGTCDLRDGSG